MHARKPVKPVGNNGHGQKVTRGTSARVSKTNKAVKGKSSLKEFSPRATVFGLPKNEEEMAADERLKQLGFEVIDVISLSKQDHTKFVLIYVNKNYPVFIRTNKFVNLPVKILKSVDPINAEIPEELLMGTFNLCHPECVGVVIPYNGQEIFVTDTVQAIPTYDKFTLPIPICDYESISQDPIRVRASLITVTTRIQRHLLGEVDDALDQVVESYNELTKEITAFFESVDGATEKSNGELYSLETNARIIQAGEPLIGVIEKLRQIKEAIRLSSLLLSSNQ